MAIAWWGLVPAAGAGSRIQPLAFSKELLPVGSRHVHGVERPRAVSEYLIERFVAAGVRRICFVIGPTKSDILQYYGGSIHDTPICYIVQDRPGGLCDAVFRLTPFVTAGTGVILGLPDTVWFPEHALRDLPEDRLSMVLFPVAEAGYFDAVCLDGADDVREVQVKHERPATSWIWGAIGIPAPVFLELDDLWRRRRRADEYLGTLINAYLAEGGRARGLRRGEAYVDVGTLHGYRQAMHLLDRRGSRPGDEVPGGPR